MPSRDLTFAEMIWRFLLCQRSRELCFNTIHQSQDAFAELSNVCAAIAHIPKARRLDSELFHHSQLWLTAAPPSTPRRGSTDRPPVEIIGKLRICGRSCAGCRRKSILTQRSTLSCRRCGSLPRELLR